MKNFYVSFQDKAANVLAAFFVRDLTLAFAVTKAQVVFVREGGDRAKLHAVVCHETEEDVLS